MVPPDVHGAQNWAEKYLKGIETKLPELMGQTGDLSYRVELLREALGITEDTEAGGWNVPYIASYSLLAGSKKKTAAFDLIRSIIADNLEARVQIPDCWTAIAAELVSGKAKRPTRGKQPQKGVRDLIFLIMAQHLTEDFGLHLGKNEATSKNGNCPSACELIDQELRAVGFPQQSPGAIERAIRRIME